MISVIHPSRGRPERARKAYDILKSRASEPFEYILSVDEDDEKLSRYVELFKGLDVVIGVNRSMIDAAQAGLAQATGRILMIFSDDFEAMPQGWDKSINRVTAGKEFFNLKIYDGIHKWICTIPIIDRKLYEYLGHVYNPEYRHMFGDTELAAICDLMGVTLYHNEIKFPHNQFTLKNNPDAINHRNNSFWGRDMEVYLNRFKAKFGLPPEMIKGKIKDAAHLAWVDKSITKR
jgi:hypothetical protein